MMSFRFRNEEQKRANLAILRDLLVDNKDDQPAKTSLSNAIAMAEATLVTGELDKMIERTNRMHWRSTIGMSVFFIVLGFAELAWAYLFPATALPTIIFALCIWFYAYGLHVQYRLQQQYHTTLRWLDGQAFDLPAIPVSLIRVH
jgi:hypothetical protein